MTGYWKYRGKQSVENRTAQSEKKIGKYRAPGRSKGIVECYTGEGQKEETL